MEVEKYDELFSDDMDIPCINSIKSIPLNDEINFIPFNYVKSCKDKSGKSVHFFLDDYQFERVWNKPEVYMKMLQGFRYVMQPDFSLFTDSPLPVQLYNHFRKQYISAYWESQGICVIPTVCWSNERSFEFCFKGLPSNKVVCVSSVGTQLDRNSKRLFVEGYNVMMEALTPSTILFYGKIPDEINRERVIRIPSYAENMRGRVNKNGR